VFDVEQNPLEARLIAERDAADKAAREAAQGKKTASPEPEPDLDPEERAVIEEKLRRLLKRGH